MLTPALMRETQATSFGNAVDEINRMINWRLSDEPVQPDDELQGKGRVGMVSEPHSPSAVITKREAGL